MSTARESAACRSRPDLVTAAEQGGVDTGEIVADCLIERTTARQAKRVENGAVDLRRTIIGDQRIEAVAGACRDLLGIMRGEMAERSSWPCRRYRRLPRAEAPAATARNCPHWTAPGSCRTISAQAFPRPRPNANGRRQTRSGPGQNIVAPRSASPRRTGTACADERPSHRDEPHGWCRAERSRDCRLMPRASAPAHADRTCGPAQVLEIG